MEALNIWILENDSDRIILKGKPNPDIFWIELYGENGLAEISDMVNSWDEVPALMSKYNWKSLETVSVHSIFTRLITDFQRAYGDVTRPNSRERILELYDRFLNGREVVIKRTAYEFNVGTEEIKRDIKIIREFLRRDEHVQILYVRNSNSYKLERLS